MALLSPHRPCEYFGGDLDLKRGKFLPETYGVLDPGTFSAGVISVDEQGRTILWLWESKAADPAKGWSTCMVMPRIITMGEDGFEDRARRRSSRHCEVKLRVFPDKRAVEAYAGDSAEAIFASVDAAPGTL